MGFGINVNYDEAGEGGSLLPEGDYETVIKYAGEDVTKGGTVYINVTLIIRNDINQAYKNKYIWYALWKRKEPGAADIAVGGYSAKQIQTLSKSAGLPNGKKYGSIDDWYDDLKGKVILVTIKHETYNNQQQAKVSFINPSKHPICKHVFKTDSTQSVMDDPNKDFVEIGGEDDLPF